MNPKIMSQQDADNYYEMIYRFTKVIEELNLKYHGYQQQN